MDNPKSRNFFRKDFVLFLYIQISKQHCCHEEVQAMEFVVCQLQSLREICLRRFLERKKVFVWKEF